MSEPARNLSDLTEEELEVLIKYYQERITEVQEKLEFLKTIGQEILNVRTNKQQ